MSVAQKFYKTLVDILCSVGDLDAQSGMLQADRAIAHRFGVSESTARNWRRGTNVMVAASTVHSIITLCEQIAPSWVTELEFISHLSHGVPELKHAAERLLDTLSEGVFSDKASWHIYSGPLKMAHDPRVDPEAQRQLMRQASMIVDRALEMRLDQADIPCIGELIRYCAHGWFLRGYLKTREYSLSSPAIGVFTEGLSPVEAVLYTSDGCAGPALAVGRLARAKAYISQALALLQQISPSETRHSDISLNDAYIVTRSFQMYGLFFEGEHADQELMTRFIRDYSHQSGQHGWVEGIKQEALGQVMLIRGNYAQAAYHFTQATTMKDHWVGQWGLPFCVTSPHFWSGYVRLKIEGPTDTVKAEIEEGLLKALDFGAINDQIKGRLCQAAFHDQRGEKQVAWFHRQKAHETAVQYGLTDWYTLIERIVA